MPLLRMRGKIKIKPLKCTDDTIVCIYLLKSKIPFMVDVFDGDVEIVEIKEELNYKYKNKLCNVWKGRN